jgi:transcriptional regulator with XRE-family HTH domain
VTSLAAKIDLVMKALTLSRGRLAAELAVNKSMVSRWLSGTVIPSSHNLSQLTLLVAQRVPGFTLLDWDRDLAALADRLGAGIAAPVHAPAAPPPPPAEDAMPAFRSMTGARREIARHGAAYEGLWQGVRPACTQPGVVLREHILIQKVGPDLRIVWGGAGWRCEGWLMPILGQLYGMMSDDADDSVQFCILNGNRMPRVDTIDGLILTNAKDTTDTPTAEVCLLERVGDLTGDAEADEARYEALRQRYATTNEISDEVRAHIFPDTGPAAVTAGLGDLLLRLPLPRSKSKGTPAGGWS